MSKLPTNKLPTGIILAAGKSERFGSNKLLHKLRDGKTILQCAIENITSVLDKTIVVISPESEYIRNQLLEYGIDVVVNKHADQGMGASLACGVMSDEDAPGWLIALGDMPYIKPATIRTLVSRFKNENNIIAPQFNSKRGHPVVFGDFYKDKLLSLKDDVGAKSLIDQFHNRLDLVETTDSGVVTDIDYRPCDDS